jgi:peptidyl-prolyl cis-trans isomerase-like 4
LGIGNLDLRLKAGEDELIFFQRVQQMSVLIDTTAGEIVIDLYTDKCYRSTLNFLKLCKLKKYNFHQLFTVQKNSTTQIKLPSTIPTSIWGFTQGMNRNLFKPEKKYSHDKTGLVSFNTQQIGDLTLAASEFFITLGSDKHLDTQGAVFGIVVEGLDILEKINNTIVDEDMRPFIDIRIKHTVILDDPFDDLDNMIIPDQSPKPTKEMLENVRMANDDELLNLTETQREELEKINENKARELTLEMIGDLPFAEIKPPENVLFICKLNSYTKQEDLEMIFGRFGELNSCEIIKDKNGESMCYGFIEYENKEDCEMVWDF